MHGSAAQSQPHARVQAGCNIRSKMDRLVVLRPRPVRGRLVQLCGEARRRLLGHARCPHRLLQLSGIAVHALKVHAEVEHKLKWGRVVLASHGQTTKMPREESESSDWMDASSKNSALRLAAQAASTSSWALTTERIRRHAERASTTS